MPTIKDDIVASLIKQLAADDAALYHNERSYQMAKSSFEVATARYVALRDVVTRRLGYSPYSAKEPLYLGPNGDEGVSFPTNGRFRFVDMSPGDAAVAALGETDEPMPLDQLVDALKAGGIDGPTGALTRTVNAALMRKAGIVKTEDGRYYLERGGEDDVTDAWEVPPYTYTPPEGT